MTTSNAKRQAQYRSRLRQLKIQETIKQIEKLQRQLRRLYKTEGNNGF